MSELPTFTVEELKAFENEVAMHYKDGKIHGPVHLSDGNEASLIEIFKKVKPEDWVFSTHRSHYHALLKGVPRDWVMNEILAGGSITINNPDYRFYASAIMGDSAQLAAGVALALKLKKSPEHVWCFVGDMFSEMGAFHESQKYAKRNGLPITFVVEDNDLSVVTPTKETWGMEKGPDNIIRYNYRNERYPHAGINKEYSGF